MFRSGFRFICWWYKDKIVGILYCTEHQAFLNIFKDRAWKITCWQLIYRQWNARKLNNSRAIFRQTLEKISWIHASSILSSNVFLVNKWYVLIKHTQNQRAIFHQILFNYLSFSFTNYWIISYSQKLATTT